MSAKKSLFVPPLFVPCFDAGAGHAFAEAAFGKEVLLQFSDLLVKQVVGYLDQVRQSHWRGWWDLGVPLRRGTFRSRRRGFGSVR